ncbi:MAG: hypothetical protein L0H53_03195 [Candidatus Nitrosocosmicus sp.]|nr:hypothetical protein [Candidatus Nitrosocosmicus sp.]
MELDSKSQILLYAEKIMYKTKEFQYYAKIINNPILYAITGFALVLMLPFSYVVAAPMNPNFGSGDGHISGPDETGIQGYLFMACCWYEDAKEKCQICEKPNGGIWGNCGEVHGGKSLPTSDITPPQDGVLKQPDNPTPRTPGQSIFPGGVLEQPETSDEKDDLRKPNIGSGGVLEQPEETSANNDDSANVPSNGEVLRE